MNDCVHIGINIFNKQYVDEKLLLLLGAIKIDMKMRDESNSVFFSESKKIIKEIEKLLKNSCFDNETLLKNEMFLRNELKEHAFGFLGYNIGVIRELDEAYSNRLFYNLTNQEKIDNLKLGKLLLKIVSSGMYYNSSQSYSKWELHQKIKVYRDKNTRRMVML